MSKEKTTIGAEPIYDATKLGTSKMIILGIQHMFAMFGATILVPALTGLSVSATLLFAGLGTLLFHLITKRKVPAFLGSSFAFIGGYAAVAPMIDGQPNKEMLPYACFGVACAGLVYLILAGLIKVFGSSKVMKYFPPDCNRSYHYRYRSFPFPVSNQQLFCKQVDCHGCYRSDCSLQHLG